MQSGQVGRFGYSCVAPYAARRAAKDLPASGLATTNLMRYRLSNIEVEDGWVSIIDRDNHESLGWLDPKWVREKLPKWNTA